MIELHWVLPVEFSATSTSCTTHYVLLTMHTCNLQLATCCSLLRSAVFGAVALFQSTNAVQKLIRRAVMRSAYTCCVTTLQNHPRQRDDHAPHSGNWSKAAASRERLISQSRVSTRCGHMVRPSSCLSRIERERVCSPLTKVAPAFLHGAVHEVQDVKDETRHEMRCCCNRPPSSRLGSS